MPKSSRAKRFKTGREFARRYSPFRPRVEIKNLRWQDVDLFGRIATIRRSKTAAGHRTMPLNGDAMAAFAGLLKRASALGSNEPEHLRFHRLQGADH